MTLHVLPPASVIKSVQYGTVALADSATSGTATISSVDANKAVVHFLGVSTDSNMVDNQRRWLARVTLTNATTVTASRGAATTTNAMTVSFVVAEYY
jgi:Zn-dependent alcohol dehydrogenase